MANLRSATVLFALCSLLVGGKTLAADKSQQTGVSSERLDITFDYQRGGIASSQYAIWVEDAIGRPVRTIFVTRFTATRGFSERPDAVPTWGARFNPSQMTSAQIDAVSGATPSNGTLRYTWDGTDEQASLFPLVLTQFFSKVRLLEHSCAVLGAGSVGRQYTGTASRDGFAKTARPIAIRTCSTTSKLPIRWRCNHSLSAKTKTAGKPSFGVCRPIAGLENRALGVAITSQGRTSTETCRRRCKRSCSPFQSRSWKRFQRGRPTCNCTKTLSLRLGNGLQFHAGLQNRHRHVDGALDMTFCEFIGFANVNQNHAFFHHLLGHIRRYLVVGRMYVSKRLGGLRIHRFLGAGNAHRKDRGHHGGRGRYASDSFCLSPD